MKKYKGYCKMGFVALLLLAVFMAGCGGNGGSGGSLTAETTAPTVTFTEPANADTGVAINKKIAATFSKGMAPLTITNTTFTVTGPGGTPVSGTVAYVGLVATFKLGSNLAINTTYTAMITIGARDLVGNPLAANYTWTFTTGAAPDTTAPTVTFTDPARGDTGVAINRKIAATFSKGMDPATITNATFTLKVPGVTPVSGTVTYVGLVATFAPGGNLLGNTLYTATITTGAMDLAGNPLAANYTWTFTTGAAPDTTAPTVTFTDPARDDTGVATNKKIAATFSKGMNPATITNLTFTVAGVQGIVTYDAITKIATFKPTANFAPNTTYTATITTGVRDLAGNPLAANYTWTFTTGTQEAQTVAQASVPLGSSSNFAILASAAITNIPTSKITGDVGLTPDAGSNISGFSDPLTLPEVTGVMYTVDASGPAAAHIDPTRLTKAKTDAQIAFINARAAVRGTPAAISGNLNGLTLYPGLYESGSTIEISAGGHLYLDAQGDANAVFIIRSATSITTEDTSEVVLTKGAKATNVYWTAGSAVTLGTNSIMKGTLIAETAISLLNGANLEGRALNQGPAAAAITLDRATITIPSP